MVSIQEFAQLCNCSTQTLRYYDRIKLFCPKHVDISSGYRYYSIEQKEVFFQIKELQGVGFSIKEIKGIKELNEETFLAMLDEKIALQEELLAKTKLLKKTYQKRKMEIEEEIKQYQEMKVVNIQQVQQNIYMAQGECSYTLQLQRDAKQVAIMLKDMQEEVLIGLDLSAFRNCEQQQWDYKQLQDWNSVKEAVEQIRKLEKQKHDMVIHLFYVNESISLYDIGVIMDCMAELGYGKEDSLFCVSLSHEPKNAYIALYTL